MKLIRFRTLLNLSRHYSNKVDAPPLFSAILKNPQPQPRAPKTPKLKAQDRGLQRPLAVEITGRLREAFKSNSMIELTEDLRKDCLADPEAFIGLLESILRFSAYYPEFSTKFYADLINANAAKLNFEDCCLVYFFLYRFNLLRRFEDFKQHIRAVKPPTVASLHNKYVQFYCLLSRLDSYAEIVARFEMGNLDIDKEILGKLIYKVEESNACVLLGKVTAFGDRQLRNGDVRAVLNFTEIYAGLLSNLTERFPELLPSFKQLADPLNSKLSARLNELIGFSTNFELGKIFAILGKFSRVLDVQPDTITKAKEMQLRSLTDNSTDKLGDLWMLINYNVFLINEEGFSQRALETESLLCELVKSNPDLHLTNEAFRALVKYLGNKLDLIDNVKELKNHSYELETQLLSLIVPALNKAIGRRALTLKLTAKLFYIFKAYSWRIPVPEAQSEYLRNVKRLEFLVAYHAKAWIYSENKLKQFFEDYKAFCSKKKVGSKKCLALVQMALDNVPMPIRAQQYQKFEELKTAKIDLEKKKQKKPVGNR